MLWSRGDASCVAMISDVAALSGVVPTPAMWNDFNDMQEAGWLDGVRTTGDTQARWLTWLLLQNGKLRAKENSRET